MPTYSKSLKPQLALYNEVPTSKLLTGLEKMSPVVSDFVHSKTTCVVCANISLMAMAFQGKLVDILNPLPLRVLCYNFFWSK